MLPEFLCAGNLCPIKELCRRYTEYQASPQWKVPLWGPYSKASRSCGLFLAVQDSKLARKGGR